MPPSWLFSWSAHLVYVATITHIHITFGKSSKGMFRSSPGRLKTWGKDEKKAYRGRGVRWGFVLRCRRLRIAGRLGGSGGSRGRTFIVVACRGHMFLDLELGLAQLEASGKTKRVSQSETRIWLFMGCGMSSWSGRGFFGDFLVCRLLIVSGGRGCGGTITLCV